MRHYDISIKYEALQALDLNYATSTSGIEWAELDLMLELRKHFVRPVLRKDKNVRNGYRVYRGNELVARATILEVSTLFPTG